MAYTFASSHPDRDCPRPCRKFVRVIKKRRKKAPEPCPRCGSLDVVPVLYGYPGPGMMEAAEKGKIELGGCCVTDRDPQKHCRACGGKFDLPPARVPR